MTDLFDQPTAPINDRPRDLENVPATIRDHYPKAWRIDELQSVTPKRNCDKELRINGERYLIWEFKPFPPDQKLIIYYIKNF